MCLYNGYNDLTKVTSIHYYSYVAQNINCDLYVCYEYNMISRETS